MKKKVDEENCKEKWKLSCNKEGMKELKIVFYGQRRISFVVVRFNIKTTNKNWIPQTVEGWEKCTTISHAENQKQKLLKQTQILCSVCIDFANFIF